MKKKVLPVLLSLVFLFSSCNITTNINKNNIISIANTMNFLTSDKCAGRPSGTRENNEAEKYIKEDKNKICHIIIHSYKTNWPYKTKEEAKNIMEHWKLNGLIKDILKGFFK